MFTGYYINPIARQQMQRERLAADIAHVDRGTGLRLSVGGAIAVILLALAVVI